MNITRESGLVIGSLFAFAVAGSAACSSSGGSPADNSGGHAGTNASAGQSAGGASGGGGGTVLGSGGSGGAALPVPRVDNTDGSSVLDTPGDSLGDGLCTGNAVSCNGMCLSTEGQTAGSCTVLKLGLYQTTSAVLTAKTLFYTAANDEILAYDLSTKTHKSLVRGLDFVQGLAVDDTNLYFSTGNINTFFQYDERSVPQAGGDVTVITPEQSAPAGELLALPDKLLLGVGNFAPYTLSTVPKTGGQLSAFGGIKGYNLVTDGTTLYYIGGDFGNMLGSTPIAAPIAGNKVNSDAPSSRFVLDGGNLYYLDTNQYLRAPAAGGASQMIQTFSVDTYVLGRTPTQILLGQDDTTTKLTHVLAMPFAGGTATDLVTVESGELKAVAANTTDLFLCVGYSHEGALLHVTL